MPIELKRTLNLPLVTFYGIGTILGAGIYVLVGKVAGAAGMFTPVAFLVASLLAALSALSYAELAARFPKSAGEAFYVKQGLKSEWLSVAVGLGIILAGIVSVSTLILGFIGYFDVFFSVNETVMVLLLTLLAGALVSWGISQSVVIASVMTLVEIAGILFIIWIARHSLLALPDRWHEMLPPASGTVWQGIIAGSFIAFYAFIGFEDIVNVAEEVKDPVKNLPRSIFIALIVTSTFYIIVAIISVLSLPTTELSASDAPLALLYQSATGLPPTAISLVSLIAVLNGVIIQMIMASRVL